PVRAHRTPLVVVPAQPQLRQIAELVVLGDLRGGEVAVIVEDGLVLRHLVIEFACDLGLEQEVVVDERPLHRLTPLARKPPSTARISPLTKLAASLARNTAAPTS